MIIMGVPVDWLNIAFGYNVSLVNGSSIPSSKFLKKNLGICYHDVREATSAGIWKVGFLKVTYNIANFLTKILSGTANYK